MEPASRQHDVLARAATLLCIVCTAPDAAAERAGRELKILGHVERAVPLDRLSGESNIIERERMRTVAVVQHAGERQKRPVVQMRICIAGRIVGTGVDLIDRSEFACPLLFGRNTLTELALVDPAPAHLALPACNAPAIAVEGGQ